MGVAQDLYDQMVTSAVWPRLKRRGFKRTKSNFHRAVDGNWQVINLQRSYYSEADHVTFNANLGVAWECVRETVRWSLWKAGTRTTEYNCHLP